MILTGAISDAWHALVPLRYDREWERLSYDAIRDRITETLRPLTASDAIAFATAFCGPGAARSKRSAIEACYRKIEGRKASWERIQF